MTVRTVDAIVRGRHGEIPVRHHRSERAEAGSSTIVWLHGGPHDGRLIVSR